MLVALLFGQAAWGTFRGHAAEDILIADFEGKDYGSWVATGQAFGTGPAQGTLPNQMAVDGFQGRKLANSYFGGDSSVGTLTSPPFQIERTYLRFLIGGGGFPGQTCLNLSLDGQVVRTATGPNTQSGGSEHLDWSQWDVREFRGRSAVLQIVDRATGGWGHINVDHLLQTDQELPRWLAQPSREILIERRYLNLPVKNGAPRRLISLSVDGQLARQFEIELADQSPDWWAFLDLAPFQGRRAAIQIDKLREDSRGLQLIDQSDEFRGSQDLYQETLRPQFHFTSRRGWNNDPNGLVYYQGEYHLFYQHNPYGWSWGNMHWGHAVSRDLVHWEELGEALFPDALGTMFSGSAVVDEHNTAGFNTGGEHAIVCFYTAAGGTSPLSKGARFTQCLAYSTDRGRTWTKYPSNPVLGHIRAENRDPKVFWYSPERKWIMALFLDQHDFALFASKDLKHWDRLSDVSLPGTGECPEFFEIAVEGRQDERRWVFYGGNGRYLVGQFDGRTFAPESGPLTLNSGNGFYASQTYNQLPASDGRRILLPWGQVNIPGMPFNQMIGLPVELSLRHHDQGLRLYANPVRELATLRVQSHTSSPQPLVPDKPLRLEAASRLLDLETEIAVQKARRIQLNLLGVPLSYDVEKQELTCSDRKAPLWPEAGKIQLRLLLDRTSIDIFANHGRVYMPMGVIVPLDNRTLEIATQGGEARLHSLAVHELKSTWPKPGDARRTP